MENKPTITGIAFERKEELGGGFRGRLRDNRDNAIHESPVTETIQQAREWVRAKVFELMGDESWAPGYVYKPDWKMNVWQR